MVSSRGTLVNKESTSEDAINKPASCSQIIFANSKEFFKINSLEVKCRNKWTKKVRVLRADKINLNLGKPLTSGEIGCKISCKSTISHGLLKLSFRYFCLIRMWN